jgi:hypothetical protein
MPPVSVTMQPRNLPAVDAELEVPLGFDDDEPLGADVLLPHAAASRPATVSATLAARVFFTDYLLFAGHHCRLFRGQPPPPDQTMTRAVAGPPAAHSSAYRSRPVRRNDDDHLDHRG